MSGRGGAQRSFASKSTKHVERCRDERDTCLTIATTFAAATGAWSRVLEVDSDGLPRHHVSGARDGAVAALVVDRERGAGLGSVRRVRQGTQGGQHVVSRAGMTTIESNGGG